MDCKGCVFIMLLEELSHVISVVDFVSRGGDVADDCTCSVAFQKVASTVEPP